MKKTRFTTTGILVTSLLCGFSSLGQVKIIGFSPEHGLAWTNRAATDVRASPVYRVEGASALTGPWQTLTNTSQTSLADLQAISPSAAFYRVTWTNGQAWSYAGYSGQSLIATGMLYVGVSDPSPCIIDGGAYDLAPGSAYRSGFGTLAPVSCGQLDYDTIAFSPYSFDDYFYVEVVSAGTENWSGNWSWVGFLTTVDGTFVATRIVNGP